jgi:hypothetical protein
VPLCQLLVGPCLLPRGQFPGAELTQPY